MDFVLGPDPVNWTTGPPPPSPASAFNVTTPPSVIASPGKVPTSPSLAILREEARRHRQQLLRRVAFAMMAVAIVLMAVAASTVWWFCWRRGKKGHDANQKANRSQSVNVSKWVVTFTRAKRDISTSNSKGERIRSDASLKRKGSGVRKEALRNSVLEVSTKDPSPP
jgi:hypothetical protein